MKCQAKRSNGSACRNWAREGATVCNRHGGKAPQVAAKAAVRAELMHWRLGDALDDPGETLLRLLTQSRARADAYAMELERIARQFETLQEALIGDSLITGADGTVHKAGEYIRGIVELETQERDRCANFAVKAIAAGLAERSVRLAEQQGALIAQVIRAVMADERWGLSKEQREEGLRIATEHLRALPAA